MNKQDIHTFFEIDTVKLKEVITESATLEDNEELFTRLSSIAHAKKLLKDALDDIESIEGEAKGLINNRAKTLYGASWQVIAGKGYKINRIPTGSIYVRNPDIPAPKKFIEIKESINTAAVDLFIEKTGKLPKGIEVNPARGDSIRISVQ